MKKFTIAFVAVMVAGFTALMAGGDIAPIEPVKQETPKFYIGGNIGMASTTIGLSTNLDIDSDVGVIGADIGYQVLPWLAVEGRYGFNLNDNYQGFGFDNDRNYWGLYVKPSYVVYDAKLYALIGYGETNNKDGFSGGAGIAYPLVKNTEVFVDYVYFDSGDSQGLYTDHAGVVSAGLNYKF